MKYMSCAGRERMKRHRVELDRLEKENLDLQNEEEAARGRQMSIHDKVKQLESLYQVRLSCLLNSPGQAFSDISDSEHQPPRIKHWELERPLVICKVAIQLNFSHLHISMV